MTERLLLLATELTDRIESAKTVDGRAKLLSLAITALEHYDIQPHTDQRLHIASQLRLADLLYRYANQPARCDQVISRVLVQCGSRPELSSFRTQAQLLRCMLLHQTGQTKVALQIAKDAAATATDDGQASFVMMQYVLGPSIASARAVKQIDNRLGTVFEAAVFLQSGRQLPADLAPPAELKDILDHLHVAYSLLSHLFAGETTVALSELAILQTALDKGDFITTYDFRGMLLHWLDRETFLVLVMLLSGAVHLANTSSRRGQRMLQAGMQQLVAPKTPDEARLRYEIELLHLASLILHSQVDEATAEHDRLVQCYGEHAHLTFLRASIAQLRADFVTARELYVSLQEEPTLGLLAKLSLVSLLRLQGETVDEANDLLRNIERDCFDDATLCTTHLLLQATDRTNALTLTKRQLNDVVQRSVLHCNAQFRAIAFDVLAARAIGDPADVRANYASMAFKLVNPSDVGDMWRADAAQRIAGASSAAGDAERATRYAAIAQQGRAVIQARGVDTAGSS